MSIPQWTLAIGLFWKSRLYWPKLPKPTLLSTPEDLEYALAVWEKCLWAMRWLNIWHSKSSFTFSPCDIISPDLVRHPVLTLSLQSYWKRQESALISFCSCSLFNSYLIESPWHLRTLFSKQNLVVFQVQWSSCNIFSTQDHAAAAIAKAGIPGKFSMFWFSWVGLYSLFLLNQNCVYIKLFWTSLRIERAHQKQWLLQTRTFDSSCVASACAQVSQQRLLLGSMLELIKMMEWAGWWNGMV